MALPPMIGEDGKPRKLTKWQHFYTSLQEWIITAIVVIGILLLYSLYARWGLPIGNPGKNVP
jgi:hypothetical protein